MHSSVYVYAFAYSCDALGWAISKLGVFNFLSLLVVIGACWWAAKKAHGVAPGSAANMFAHQIRINESRSRVRRTTGAATLSSPSLVEEPVEDPLSLIKELAENPPPSVEEPVEKPQPLGLQEAVEQQPPTLQRFERLSPPTLWQTKKMPAQVLRPPILQPPASRPLVSGPQAMRPQAVRPRVLQLQVSRQTIVPQPAVLHVAAVLRPPPSCLTMLSQLPVPHLTMVLRPPTSQQIVEPSPPTPQQTELPSPPTLQRSEEPEDLSPCYPPSNFLALEPIFKTLWTPEEAHRIVDGKSLGVLESPSGAFVAWPIKAGWDLCRRFCFSPEAKAFADRMRGKPTVLATVSPDGPSQSFMVATTRSLGSVLTEIYSPGMIHSHYWAYSSMGGQYSDWHVEPINMDKALLACFCAHQLVAKLPWSYLFNCGRAEDLYMAMHYSGLVAYGALNHYGDEDIYEKSKSADKQPAEPSTDIDIVDSGKTTSAPLSGSDRDGSPSSTGITHNEPPTISRQPVEPVSADGATEGAADANNAGVAAQTVGPIASTSGSSSESPASNTSGEMAHKSVAEKVAENDDGPRSESSTRNIANESSGVLPAGNSSRETDEACHTSINSEPPKVRRNSAPVVATKVTSKPERHHASNSDGAATPAPTAKPGEPVSAALIAMQVPAVTETDGRVAEPAAIGTATQSATLCSNRGNKGKKADIADAVANSSNSSGPSDSGSKVVVNVSVKQGQPVTTNTMADSANPFPTSFVTEQAAGPVTKPSGSVQIMAPGSNGVLPGGEVTMQAGEPFASSDVGHQDMLIDVGLQPGEPVAIDTVMQDMEPPATDMAVEDAEPLTTDMAMEEAGSFAVDTTMQDAEMLSDAGTAHVVVPRTVDAEMEAVVPAVVGMEVEERLLSDAGLGIRKEEPLADGDVAIQDEEPCNGDANMDVVPAGERKVARLRQRRLPGSNFMSRTLTSFDPSIDPNVLFPSLVEALAALPPLDTSHVDPGLLANMPLGFNNSFAAGALFVDPGVATNVLPDFDANIAAGAPLFDPGNGLGMLPDLNSGLVANTMLPNAGVATNTIHGLDASVLPGLSVSNAAGVPLLNPGNEFGALPGFSLENPVGTVLGLGMGTANMAPLLNTSAHANVPPSSSLDNAINASSGVDVGVLSNALLAGASTQSYTLGPPTTELLPSLDHIDMVDLMRQRVSIGTSNDTFPVNNPGTGALPFNALYPSIGAIPPPYPALDAYSSNLINGGQDMFIQEQLGLRPMTVLVAADTITGAVPGTNRPLANLNEEIPLPLGDFNYPWLNPGSVDLAPNREGLAFKETEEIAYNLAPQSSSRYSAGTDRQARCAADYIKSAKAGIESVEYIDDLIREYLLFRGFKNTLKALEEDLQRDQDRGFSAEKIADELLGMATSLDADGLLEYWQYMSYRFFSHLSPKYHRTTRMFEKRLIRLFLVSAINADKREKIRQFMDKHGKTLGQQGGDWIPWLGLEYVDEPSARPEFEAHFSDDWLASLRSALIDFIQTVFPAMAVPRIMLFDKDQREREALQHRLKVYEEQLHGETKIKALELSCMSSLLVEDHIGGVAVAWSPNLKPATAEQAADSIVSIDQSLGVIQTNEPSSILKISQEDVFLEHNSGINLAMFSATGALIASYDDESILKIWSPDLASAAPKLKNELDFTVNAMAWDKKHAHLLYLYDEDGYLHTLNTNTNLMSRQLLLERRHPWIQSMQASSASSTLLTVSSTKPEGTSDLFVHIWDANANKTIASKRLVPVAESHGVCAALNHNGNLAALAYNTGQVRLLDTRTLETVASISTKQRGLCSAVFSLDEDSLMVVTETGGLTQWSLRKDSQMTAESSLSMGVDGGVVSADSRLDYERVAFTPDRESIVIAPKDQCLVFNVDSAALTDTMRRHKDLVSCVDFVADRSLSASEDGTIRVARYRKV
ncbi:hypothetical protein IWW37_001230 [Coemansia sp. RSA 2050]|nr:hypothetical protein IWW37_001230 [Coemansia sp. RSA 2050]